MTVKIEDLRKLENETERVSALYDIFDEGTRLSTKSTQIEFLTTIRQIEKHLRSGMRILDLGAGTGKYSIYFAKHGYEVTAVELVEKHVKEIRDRVSLDMPIQVFQGNALDLSMIEDNTYDIVLCFGPLYHLTKIEDRMQCIKEAKRVCKANGKMLFAFISNDMVITTETFLYTPDFLLSDLYDHNSFKVEDFPFVFHTIDDCRGLLRNANVKIISEVAADGLSELFADKINSMDEESYIQWLNFHFYCCERPEFLGASNHLLFVGEK
jgi:ubiquinone/menaquinone biosynthesis C-methylase UbiE